MSEGAELHPQTPWDSVTPESPVQPQTQTAPLCIAGDQTVSVSTKRGASSDGWTIPLISLGIAIIACCVLIPLGDKNRRLVYEHEKLAADMAQIDHQIAVNDEFLVKINDDPTLAERLALRQMKVVRRGTGVLELQSNSKREDTSPFLLVNVPPPPQMKAYQPVGNKFAAMCRDRKTRLYLMGAGMMMLAVGLVLGASSKEAAN